MFGSSLAVIGNYSELNSNDCGFTRMTIGFSDNCFEWHKNPFPTLIGRNATEREVPWIVDIRRTANLTIAHCTGSTIGNQWVLTAAHCLFGNISNDYTIYLGYLSMLSLDKIYQVKAIEFYSHPGYIPGTISNDLALIKLEKQINSIKAIEGQRVSTELKNICLPKRNTTQTKQEYALNAGWGSVNRTALPLQMGYKLMTMYNSSIIPGFPPNMIIARLSDNQALNCKGDSGSPLWQFNLGRAVIVGVMAMASIRAQENKLCEPQNEPRSYSVFVKISDYIDWIQSITQLN